MIRRDALITPAYAAMQRALHAGEKPYGEYGKKWSKTVLAVAQQYDAGSVLDYGCGEGTLTGSLKAYRQFSLSEYDPGVPGKDGPPSFADVVVCTDVLEHVEPNCLDSVLAHLRMLARRAVFVVVALVPTAHMLPDGRNAHLIIRPANWWKKRIEAAGFTIRRPPACARKKKSHEWVAVLEP